MFAEEIKKSLAGILPEAEIPLEHPAGLAHGDYSTNVALVLAKKEGKNPKEAAEELVKKWQKVGLPDFVNKVEVAGPGFINIWLNFDAFITGLVEVLKEGDKYGSSICGQGKTIVIDYSSPNIAKPFGIGHLRSTNIGQAIYNLYHFLGWKTIGDNHLGDWGTQFGKLIFQILRYKDIKALSKLTIEELEKLYVEFHKEAETKPELEEEARKWFKKLEEGDPEAKRIWLACVDISLKEFDRIYQLLNIKIDYAYGESFYLEKMAGVLQECEAKGLLEKSQGAKVVEIPGIKLPAMLVKSDGATTYFLRDLAAIKYRTETFSPSLIVYEVGADQTLHFQQLFNVAVQLGYGQLNQFVHISHGLIRWPTGKFSTREGKTIHLEKVLSEAIERAEKLCETAGVAKEMSAKERRQVAKSIGIGAIKYNDLKQNPRTDIVFDWDQILSLSGNSGPYLQYTYARTQSVLKKSEIRSAGWRTKPEINSNFQFSNLSNEESILLRTIYRFPEVAVEAAKTFSPNLLCNFLFDLSQKFNLFYDKKRILGNENESFRLLLTAAVGQILKNGLQLLGIEALERM